MINHRRRLANGIASLPMSFVGRFGAKRVNLEGTGSISQSLLFERCFKNMKHISTSLKTSLFPTFPIHVTILVTNTVILF